MQASNNLVVVVYNKFQAHGLDSVNFDFVKNIFSALGDLQVKKVEVSDFSKKSDQSGVEINS